jgi:hypothetical protein
MLPFKKTTTIKRKGSGYVKRSCTCANNNTVRKFQSDRQTTNELVSILDLLPRRQLLLNIAIHVISMRWLVMLASR